KVAGVLASFNMSQADAEMLIPQARAAAGSIDASELPPPGYAEGETIEGDPAGDLDAEADSATAAHACRSGSAQTSADHRDDQYRDRGWEPQLSMRSSETLVDRDRQDLASRQALDESRLIRFVADPDGAVVPDLARKLPGRGLWVAADRASLEAAIKKNLFAR